MQAANARIPSTVSSSSGIMSCTPTSSIQRSGSLSPSDESRFVPRSSIATSVVEQHFVASKAPEKSDDAPLRAKEVEGVKTAAVDAVHRGQDDDDKSVGGIVGATICFTPQPSPRSSPTNEGAVGREESTHHGSIDGSSNDYIGSVRAFPSGSGTVEGVLSSKMSSSARHVASSLDGRSTTEYEMLDGISSKGTIEVEDLILEGDDDDEEYAARGNESKEGREDAAAILGSLSPASTIPSLHAGDASEGLLLDTPLNMLKTPQPSETKARAPEGNEKFDANSDAGDATNQNDDDSSSTSPKIDERPLTPFQNLHKFWERQSTFTHMTRSVLGRILRAEHGVDSDATETRADAKPDDGPVDPSPPKDDSSSPEKNGQPSGASPEDPVQQNLQVASTTTPLLRKAKGILFGIASSAMALFISIGFLIGVFLCGLVTSSMMMAKRVLGQVLLRKPNKEMIAQASTETADAPQSGTDSPEKIFDEPPGTNLSKLFEDEVLKPEENTLGPLDEPITREESEEIKQFGNDDSSAALEPKENALFNRILDQVAASITSKLKTLLSRMSTAKVWCAIPFCIGAASIVLMYNYLTLESGVGVHDSESQVTTQEKMVLVQSLEGEGEHLCALTHLLSFASIPLMELVLLPDSLNQTEEAVAARQGSDGAGSRSWFSAFFFVSIVTSLTYAFKSKIPFLPTKAKHNTLTGIWSEEEHQQFLRGYNEHGNRWKLVSAFIPTRTPTQVKTHGHYWLKIRSPLRMAKARKTPHSAEKTPASSKKQIPATPSSISSTKSTPRKTNKTSANLTPIKVLAEKSGNQLHKNVTPRSEERTRRMMAKKAQGSKSDPVKRVRIKTP